MKLFFSTVIAEIKNAFVDAIDGPELIELLYRGVSDPLGIKLGKIQEGAASKIVNRAPQGNALRIIRGHSQDPNSEIYSHVDHTLLKAYASWEEIKKLCDEAVQYRTASVCIPPSYIKRVRENYGKDFRICTVIGFPLGYSTKEVKVSETLLAVKDGADEIDTVINLGDVKNKEYGQILAELKAIRTAAEGRILKVIIETCYLTEEEKRELCHVVTESGADYIKTSTGFGTEGAVLADIFLFKEEIGPDVKIKATGGMHSRQDFIDFLNVGCDRLGTSSAVKVLETPV